MRAFLARRRIELEDWLRYSVRVRSLIARVKSWRRRGTPSDVRGLLQHLKHWCSVARLTASAALMREAERRALELAGRVKLHEIPWAEHEPVADDPWLSRTAILKPYLGPKEPGIIYAGFETEWAKFLRHVRLAEFAERYTFILAPSSFPHNYINFLMAAHYPTRLYSLVNHAEDIAILERMTPRYRVVPMYTSHWVNPARYQPLPLGERDIDILMVAAWGKVKRHFTLFRALSSLPRTWKVLLIGQDQEGRTADSIRREAAYYGVADRFQIWSSAPHAKVREAFCRAKVSILLSVREGSAVVVPESLFANAPVALFANAENGSRDFINPQTGILLNERTMAQQLLQFVNGYASFQAREWAEANISCHISTQKLNALLKQDALAEGRAWTRDIFPLCWQPDPRLVNLDDWQSLQEEREDIQRRFGLDVRPRTMD